MKNQKKTQEKTKEKQTKTYFPCFFVVCSALTRLFWPGNYLPSFSHISAGLPSAILRQQPVGPGDPGAPRDPEGPGDPGGP